MCVRACAPLAPRPPWGAACGAGLCGCCLGWGLPPPPLPFGFFLGGASRCPWVLWSRSPHSLSFGLRVCVFFVFFFRVVCVRVFWVSLLPVGRRSRIGVAGFGWVVLRCSFGWGVWLRLVVWVGGFVAAGLSRAPPPVFFFRGGSACSSLCPPWAGARTGWCQCGLRGCFWCLSFSRPCPGPVGRVGYVHVELGVPSCGVRFFLCRLGGCARRLPEALGLKGWGFPCPFPSAVPVLTFWWRFVWADRHHCCQGAQWPLAGVWRAGAAPSGSCGGLFWLDPGLASLALVLWCAVVRRAASCHVSPWCVVVVRAVSRPAGSCRVAPCRAVVCRFVPRSVVSCCGVLCLRVPCRRALHCGSLRCGVPCCLLLCRGGSVEVSLARVVAEVRVGV